ncbi:hypothetical protein PR003_g7521 [Phytophthora rubi]|uniref:Uncharacterized protein n=1 Tax=Phytophthora rubi TaxID=129364 RepID=A0A6A4FDQ4_9STRA|nr:hypothetical protein PR003_g7521 [Phytophthora rubi]
MEPVAKRTDTLVLLLEASKALADNAPFLATLAFIAKLNDASESIRTVIGSGYPFTLAVTTTSLAKRLWETPQTLPSLATDVQTFQDLISEYNVQVGHRPDIPELMQKALEGHKEIRATNPASLVPGNSTVGVFVSGPEDMKHAVEYAIADIGTSHFDVFEEEFEL